MHYYYSIYRKDYLYKGIVLYESMKLHDKNFKFFLICMEEESVTLLKKMNLKDLIPISIKEIEQFDQRIPELKSQRGEKTYIWTAKASVPLFLFNKYQELDHIIWLDGDTEFLSSPEPIYQQWGDYSVLLTEEKFTGEYEYIGHLVGFYNTGFMGFKKDETGIKCLNYFKSRLQEWKNTEAEQGSWNDQLYVDDWKERFSNVGIVMHDGINLTPFIASRINKEQNGFVNMRDGIPFIKDTPIVLYHFMALKYYDGNEFDLCNYWMKFHNETIKKLYIPYLHKCNSAFERIRAIEPGFYPQLTIEDKYLGNYFNLEVYQSEPKYNICTIALENKLTQTLTLYNSLSKQKVKFRLWICCADETSYHTLKQLDLPEVLLFKPSNLIENHQNPAQSGYQVNLQVLKPRFINLILLNNDRLENLLYVDCDCYFHQSPKLFFDQLQQNSILLFENSEPVKNKSSLNSVLGFSRDIYTLDCLYFWVQKTKEWMQNGVSNEAEIDYISSWKQLFSQVIEFTSHSCILEDGKLAKVKIRKLNDCIYVNNEVLILYKYNIESLDIPKLDRLIEKITNFAPIKKKYIYLPYLNSIRNSLESLSKNNCKQQVEDN